MSSPAKESRMPWLDGLRGIATLMIFIHHFLPNVPKGVLGSPLAYLHKATVLFFTGVDLFFVISGFLIGGIIIDNRFSPNLKSTFYMRRLTRIFPLAYLFITLACILISCHLLTEKWVPIQNIYYAYIASYAFVANLMLAFQSDWGLGALDQLWSLGIEEQFYLIAPFLIILFVKPETAALSLIILGVCSRIIILLFNHELAFAVHFLPFCRCDTMGCGILAASIVRNPVWFSSLTKNRSFWWIALSFGLTGFVLLTRINARPGTESLAFWGYTVIALTYMLILLLIGTSNSIITKFIFCNKFIIEFGRKSYFIYLFQGFIGLALSFLIHFIYPSISAHWCEWLLFLIMPFVLVFAAKVSWQLFENPFLKIGHKFKY